MDVNIIILCIIILTVLLILTIYLLVVYSGLLTDVTIGAGKPQIETTRVYYKAGVGSYLDVGPACSDVASIDPSLKSFAVYYDDPNKTHEQERWAVGAFLDLESEDQTKTTIELFERHGYKPFTFPKVQNVVKSSFPNNTPFSYSMGSYKVYPELAHYVKERKLCAHPWIEIYDGVTIEYMVPLSRQEEFYVPEVLVEKKNEKSQKPKKKRSSSKDRNSKKVDSEFDLLEEREGVVNLENKELVATEHSYASQSPDDSKENEVSVNSAGDVISETHTDPSQFAGVKNKDNHAKRSKSVNILLAKDVPDSKPLRSSSVVTCNKSKSRTNQQNSDSSKVQSFVKATALNGDDLTESNTTQDSILGDESYGDSSFDSSMSSTADTVESSFLSSEFSYSSVDSQTSQNTSRLSCELDSTASSR